VNCLFDYDFINVDNDGVTFVKNIKTDDGSVFKIPRSFHVDDNLLVCSDNAMYKKFIPI